MLNKSSFSKLFPEKTLRLELMKYKTFLRFTQKKLKFAKKTKKTLWQKHLM